VSALLDTPRLLIRPFEPGDLPDYQRLNADPEVRRYLGGTLSADAARDEMEAIARWHLKSGLGMLPIIRKSDGAFLGTCGLSVLDWYPDDTEIGWRLLPEHWGQGYATEAASAWVGHAFTILRLMRLISVADVPNIRSHAVMRRLGMRLDHTATLTDGGDSFEAHIHVLDATDWHAQRKL